MIGKSRRRVGVFDMNGLKVEVGVVSELVC